MLHVLVALLSDLAALSASERCFQHHTFNKSLYISCLFLGKELFSQSYPAVFALHFVGQNWITCSFIKWLLTKVMAFPRSKVLSLGASLVAQWLRVCLPMQGTRVRALVWEDPTCRRATGPVSHNY